MRYVRLLVLGMLLVGVGVVALSALRGAAAPGTTARVSLDSAGNQGNADSYEPAISSDGRYVAFFSWASNLVPGDTCGGDIFVRDRQTGANERVSVDSAGNQANYTSDGPPAISSDGRYVAFYSAASNLVPGDTNGRYDVFVRDRQMGTTERVSLDSAGNQGNRDSYEPAISPDGRYVAFLSSASNLVPGDTNRYPDVFVRDRQMETTERVSLDSAGNQANEDSYEPAISSDGRYVAFRSSASNLVPGDTCCGDVFVHDRQTGATERVSVDSAGNQGNSSSYDPTISPDGRYVAFMSSASNLVPGDTNGYDDVFVRDRQMGTTERISLDSAGNQANEDSYEPAISPDGRYVAFESFASNLVPGDTNDHLDVFVHDRQTGATERVSVDSYGNQGNGHSQAATISADGRYVAFQSYASNLVAGDTNGYYDIFVHDREGVATPTPTLTPTPTPTPTPPGWTPTPTPTPPPSEEGAPIAYIGIDMDPTGNALPSAAGPGSLGTIDRCVSVSSAGNPTIAVDVYANAIPVDEEATAYNYQLNWAPDNIDVVNPITEGMLSFGYYDDNPGNNSPVATCPSGYECENENLNPGNANWVLSASDPRPKATSPWAAGAMLLTSGEQSWKGAQVITRVSLKVNVAGPQIVNLWLNGAPLAVNIVADDEWQYTNPVGAAIDDVANPVLLAIDTPCPTPTPAPTPWADLRIVGQYLVSPPSTIPMNQDVLVTLKKTVHNGGPVGPVDARSEAVVTAPPGCTVRPTHVAVYSNLPVSVDVVASEPFVIHCSQPSSHTFAFDNSIEVTTAGVADPNPGNNTAHTELTVASVTQTDVKIVGETFTVRPPDPLPLNTDVDVTLRKTIHNNGGYGPVDIANDGKVWPPRYCTAAPKSVPPLISGVPVSTDVVVDEVWTIRCSEPGQHSFSFDNWIDVATAHVSDSNLANNIAHLELRDDAALVDTDRDGLTNDVDNDDDGDGFADLSEVYVSTDPLDACPDNTSDPAWPLDQDNNGTILIVGDVTSYTGKTFTPVTCPGGADCRLDVDTNGTILIVGDVTRYTGKLFATCP